MRGASATTLRGERGATAERVEGREVVTGEKAEVLPVITAAATLMARMGRTMVVILTESSGGRGETDDSVLEENMDLDCLDSAVPRAFV